MKQLKEPRVIKQPEQVVVYGGNVVSTQADAPTQGAVIYSRLFPLPGVIKDIVVKVDGDKDISLLVTNSTETELSSIQLNNLRPGMNRIAAPAMIKGASCLEISLLNGEPRRVWIAGMFVPVGVS